MKKILIVFVTLSIVWQIITFGSSCSYLQGAIIVMIQSILLRSYIEESIEKVIKKEEV